jgi:hypothetical protein
MHSETTTKHILVVLPSLKLKSFLRVKGCHNASEGPD